MKMVLHFTEEEIFELINDRYGTSLDATNSKLEVVKRTLRVVSSQ